MSSRRFSRGDPRVYSLSAFLLAGLGFFAPAHSQCSSNPTPCSGWADQCGKWGWVDQPGQWTTSHIAFPHPSDVQAGVADIVVIKTVDPLNPNSTTDGVLLLYSRDRTEVRRFYPATHTVSAWHQPAVIVNTFFCGSHTQLGDGKIAIVGGGNSADRVTIYDPMRPLDPDVYGGQVNCTGCFTGGEIAPTERYYPSSILLATGKLLAIAGTGTGAAFNSRTPMTYDPPRPSDPDGKWETLDRATHCTIPNSNCDGALAPANGLFIDYYPHVYQVPDGRVVYVGGPQAAVGNPPGNQIADFAWALDTMSPPNPSSTMSRWAALTSNKGVASVASAIYRSTSSPYWHIMKSGGADANGTATDCNPYDMNPEAATPSWQALVAPQNSWSSTNAEATNYLIVLPNRKILSLGGRSIPEIYDPDVNSWQSVANMPAISMPDPCPCGPCPTPPERGWHSAAALLADGRVLITGGRYFYDYDCSTNPVRPEEFTADNGHIYNPPYLFRNCDTAGNCEFLGRSHAARPTVSPSTPLIATGSTFSASISPGSGATWSSSACLIRPGSAEHSVDFDQRYLQLTRVGGPPTIQGTGEAQFFAPASAEEAPPGYYMFFIVNDQGVPSVAPFVQVWGIVKSSVKVIQTAYCQSGVPKLRLEISWLTSLESESGVMDRVEIRAPGSTCGVNPIVRQALPPDPNDRRSHLVVYTAPACLTGTYSFDIKSYLNGTESKITGCQFNVNVSSCPACCPPEGCQIE